jgi:hypothetical protein
VLFVVAALLLVSGVHELSEAQLLPSSRREMALIGPIVNNDAFFFVVIVALAMFLIIAQRIPSTGPRGAERRILLWIFPPPNSRARCCAEFTRAHSLRSG